MIKNLPFAHMYKYGGIKSLKFIYQTIFIYIMWMDLKIMIKNNKMKNKRNNNRKRKL